MSIDAVLKEIGSAGRYQIMVLFLMMYCKMYPGIITILPVLSAGKMDHRCKFPEGYNKSLDNDTTVSATKCFLVYNASNKVTKVSCSEWEFSTDQYTSTIRSAYNLVCDREFLAELSTTIFFVGFMIGSTIYGIVSDKFGRMVGILISASHLCILATLSAIAPNYWSYVVFRFLTGIGNGGLLACLFTMTAEVTDPKFRTIWLMNVQNGWAVGVCLLALVGYFVRNHLYLQLALGIPIATLLLLYFLIYESPRWLFGTGRVAQADKVIHSIARRNQHPLAPDFTLTSLLETETKGSESKAVEAVDVKFTDLFRYPGLRRVTFLVWLDWFVVSLGYFAMLLNLEGLGGNVYVNLTVMSLVEIPARATGLLTSVKLGRRPTLTLSYGFGGLACLVCAFMFGRPGLHVPILIVALIGQFFYTIAFDVIWMYSAEVFPTVVRTVGVGVGSTWARVGAMLAPQIGLLRNYWLPLPFLIMGILPLLAGIGSWFLPETNKAVLAETLEEGEFFVTGGRVIEVEENNTHELQNNPRVSENDTQNPIADHPNI